MQTMNIKRRLEFDAGHRLVGHEGKCKYIHGHRYVVDIYVTPTEKLDELGRVVDFGVIKNKIGAWIDHNLDHQLILNRSDKELIKSIKPWCKGQGPFIMGSNPTAENLAVLLFDKSEELLIAFDIKVMKVEVFETPNCSANVEEA